MGAAIALADAPGTGPAVKALAEAPDAQVGPAVAVNPAGGSRTSWRRSSAPTGEAARRRRRAHSRPARSSRRPAPRPGRASRRCRTADPTSRIGSPDVVWGPGNKVYAVEVARDTDDTTNPCLLGAGIYLFVSTDGGVTWGPEIEIAQNGAHQSNTDPSIAYDRVTGHIFVAYTKTDPCSAAPGDPNATSQVRVVTLYRDDAVGGTPISGPTGASTATQIQIRPSVTALPNGGVGIAYYDASPNSAGVQFVTCPAGGSRLTPSCGSPTTLDDSAPDPRSPALPGVQVLPRAAADGTGRVVVTWSKMTDANGMDVFSATSRNSGATFGRRSARSRRPGGGFVEPDRPVGRHRSGERARGHRVPRLALRLGLPGRRHGVQPAERRRHGRVVVCERARRDTADPADRALRARAARHRRPPRRRRDTPRLGPRLDADRMDRHTECDGRHAAQRGCLLDRAPARHDGTRRRRTPRPPSCRGTCPPRSRSPQPTRTPTR